MNLSFGNVVTFCFDFLFSTSWISRYKFSCLERTLKLLQRTSNSGVLMKKLCIITIWISHER